MIDVSGKLRIDGLYILRHRKPVHCPEALEWCLWMAKNERRRKIRKDRVNGILISTAFLGYDMCYEGDAVFETMIFDNDEYKNGVMMGRYGSHRAALEGHRQCKQAIKNRARNGEA